MTSMKFGLSRPPLIIGRGINDHLTISCLKLRLSRLGEIPHNTFAGKLGTRVDTKRGKSWILIRMGRRSLIPCPIINGGRERPNFIEVTEVSLEHLVYNLSRVWPTGVSPNFIISYFKLSL